MKTFTLIISKVGQNLYTGEARSLSVPGVEGDMTILAGHEPLVTTLRNATLSYTDADGQAHEIMLDTDGVLEIADNHVTVLL